jgi:tetratricopeptide (TPR) repeat protein
VPELPPKPGRSPLIQSAPINVTRDPQRDLSTMVPRDLDPSLLSRVAGALDLDRLRSGGIGLLIAAFVGVVAAGVLLGLGWRELRMRGRVTKRYEMARQKLASGNYPGFQSAELLYRQILTERDDPPARALRARTLSQMAFEFGDGTEAAVRAVAGLGEAKTEEAEEARIYLAMARGDSDKALGEASALRRKYADAPATYLYGRAELLLDRPQAAVDALRAVADLEPKDALAQHALGVAEAALRHDDRAFEAYRHALDANANHIATIIDRALLQARRGTLEDRDIARGALLGVVEKLQADCSPGQLARAHLGLAELDLWKGDLELARRELAVAAGLQRQGDVTLAEDLARDFMRAFALDEAEREAKRALAGSPRLGPRLVLAEVALRRGRPQQAVEVIDEQGATRPEALVLRAIAHLALGHKDAARIDTEAALRVQPDLVAAKVALARVELAEGKIDRAQRDLERLDRAEKSADVSTALGLVYAAERLPDRARAALREAIVRDPLSQEARLSLTAMLREAGRWDEAADELKQLLLLNGNYRPARVESARLAMVRGDLAMARDTWDALAKEDADAESLLGGARAHLLLGDAPGAEQRTLKAQKLEGASEDEVNELLARAWLAERRPAEVVALLRKNPPNTLKGPLLPLLMNAYLDLDQPERAREIQSLSPPRARFSTEGLVARARLAIDRGRDLTAESLATAALIRLRAPNSPAGLKSQALTVLGRSQWEQGDFRPSLRSLSQAIQLDPKNARAYYFAAMVDDDLKRKDDSRRALETAVELDPKFPDALYYLGRARADAGDPRSADNWRAYLEVAPKGPYADDVKKLLEAGPSGVAKVAAPTPRPKRPRPKAAAKLPPPRTNAAPQQKQPAPAPRPLPVAQKPQPLVKPQPKKK